ncbi:hypothetical protein, unknown function [Leishmania tarentolae]|uniref:Uncharacterized protein n=1 Tax=Leishmania tarentolae TaxID=5689 RepID=A0A640KBX2_LEITA|nr:hypothetical protein, unknown function [Leishmania tarentolae]
MLLLSHQRLYTILEHARVHHGEGELGGLEGEGGHGQGEGCRKFAVVLHAHLATDDGGAVHAFHSASVHTNAEGPGDEDDDQHGEGPRAHYGCEVLHAHDNDSADDVDERVACSQSGERGRTEHHGVGLRRREALVYDTMIRVPLLRVKGGGAALACTPQRVAERLRALGDRHAKAGAHGRQVGTHLDGLGAVDLEDIRDSGGDEQREGNHLNRRGEGDEHALSAGDIENRSTTDLRLAAVQRGWAPRRAEGAGLRQGLDHIVGASPHGWERGLFRVGANKCVRLGDREAMILRKEVGQRGNGW